MFYTNKIDGLKHEVMVKRAMFIGRNNEIRQEYCFAHPITKFKINAIYNSHFTGSPVWDLFSHEAEILENTWNRSIKLMFDLPLATHRYFLVPLSESQHIKSTLIGRFINFTKKLESSEKKAVTHLYKVIKNDVRSITGSNLRNIKLLLDNYNLSIIDSKSVQYHPVKEDDKWKVNCVKELIDVLHGDLSINFDRKDVEQMIEALCTN